MKATAEQIAFVKRLIERGDYAGKDQVYVDVLAIGDQFGVVWSVAMKIMRAAVKQLGHRVVARNKVTKHPAVAPPAPKPKKPTETQRAMAAVESLMAGYERKSK